MRRGLHNLGFEIDAANNDPERRLSVIVRGTGLAANAQDGNCSAPEATQAEHRLTLAQLARTTGISSSFLSLIEQAQSNITIGCLLRLAEFFDVELVDLLDGPARAPSDHVRILRTSSEHMLHSPPDGVDVYESQRRSALERSSPRSAASSPTAASRSLTNMNG